MSLKNLMIASNYLINVPSSKRRIGTLPSSFPATVILVYTGITSSRLSRGLDRRLFSIRGGENPSINRRMAVSTVIGAHCCIGGAGRGVASV